MKKIFCLILALLFTAGCARTDPGGRSALSDQAEKKERAASDIPGGKTSLRFCNPYNGTSSRQGHYLMKITDDEKTGDTHYNIMYFDFAARREIYLCDKPDCRHDGAACSSYFGLMDCEPDSLLYWEDHLYLMSSGGGAASVDGYQMSGGGPESAGLYRMNPDGSGREKFLSLSSGLRAQTPYILGEHCLYFTAQKTSMKSDGDVSAQVVEKSVLMKADLKKGALTEVMELPHGKEFYQVIGAFGEELIVLKTIYPKDPDALPPGDNQAFFAMLPDTKAELVTVSAATKKETVRISGPLDDISYYACDGRTLYYTDQKGKTLRALDVPSGKTAVLAEELPGKKPDFGSVRDGKLLLRYWDDRAVNPEFKESYAVDTVSGEINKMGLVIPKPKGPVEIIGASDSQYLVISGYETKDNYYAAYGVTQTDIIKTHYAVIEKTDYWAGRANYKPVSSPE